ncbi:MAG TPA: imidazole glycerol phosphate synthase subunit HisF [Acidimicrobiales bacterium]|jgi:cyclase|nr:imidazole glycerol phosphate synthase subunit HisF [Acidimicrobiales bacterium]
MPSARLIVCLDVREGRTVKGTRFEDLQDLGDPVEMAARYEAEGIDEVVFLDITASSEGRSTVLDVASATASQVFVPLIIGGGIRTLDDARAALNAGADKVCLTSPAVERPELISEVAGAFGSQCAVANVDAARVDGSWEVRTHMATGRTGLDAVDWAIECAKLGAGELLVTSIDRDGTRDGYDLPLIRSMREAVTIPIIASGGAGSAEHVIAAFDAGADAALLAGAIHDGTLAIPALKEAMSDAGLRVREVAPSDTEAT